MPFVNAQRMKGFLGVAGIALALLAGGASRSRAAEAAALTPTPVKASAADEYAPAEDGLWFSWTESSHDHPHRYNVYVRQGPVPRSGSTPAELTALEAGLTRGSSSTTSTAGTTPATSGSSTSARIGGRTSRCACPRGGTSVSPQDFGGTGILHALQLEHPGDSCAPLQHAQPRAANARL